MNSSLDSATPVPVLAATLTIVNGRTFTVADPTGGLRGPSTGTVFEDIRMVSDLVFAVFDRNEIIEATVLTSTPISPFSAITVHRPDLPVEAGEPTEIWIHRQWVGRGCRHDFEIHNHGQGPIDRTIHLRIGTDFAHVFDMKAGRPGPTQARMTLTNGIPTLVNQDDPEALTVRVDHVPDPSRYDLVERSLSWDVTVQAGRTETVSVAFIPIWDGHVAKPLFPAGEQPARIVGRATSGERPTLVTTDARLADAFDQALEDLASLRIFDPNNPTRPLVSAGAPWFMTLFGRDSLLSAWMALPFTPELAVGVLRSLADLQGDKENPVTEEEPGKIIHELRRHGGDAAFADRGRYYGTVDATPLFVMLAAETHRWQHLGSADLEALWPAVRRAVDWIISSIDRGPSPFVTYQRSTDIGLSNQGWKDSWDGINFADGRLPEGPIALAEVQGYVYAALRDAATLADHVADPGLDPDELRRRADEVREAFHSSFWNQSTSSFLTGLADDGTPIDSVTTNPGHAIWTGVADADRASIYLDRIMNDDLWSGWGLRTLSPTAARFNPLSYHNGSVWPHDTAIVAAGAARIGRSDVVDTVIEGALDTAQHLEDRPPELFSGIARSVAPVPIPYPSSCSPQAWASASILLHLRSRLRLEPRPGGILDWQSHPSVVSFTGLRVGDSETSSGT